MKQFLLFRLSAVVLMLTFMLPNIKAQTAETPATAIFVNGQVVERQVIAMYLTYASDGGFRYSATAPRVVLVYQTDSTSTGPTYDYFHPYACRALFGDAITNINDVRLYEIVKTDGDLQFQGLQEGQPVVVYNASGRLCLNARAGAGGHVEGLNSLPKGVYIIKAGQTVFKYYNRK